MQPVNHGGGGVCAWNCSADEDIDSKFPTNTVVYSSGLVSWIPLGLFISACAIDIQWFPFDDQRCTMKFGSWTYDGTKINLTAKHDWIDMTTYQPSGEWEILGTRMTSLSGVTIGRARRVVHAGPALWGPKICPTLFFLKFFGGRGGPFGILARGPTATLLRH